jgi:alkyl sulfatase BDS1-like metallo-beta-lactamase superfamily hydrolase
MELKTKELVSSLEDEIMAEMQKVVEKITSEKLARHFKGWNKTMQYYFTDTDEKYYIKLVNGIPEQPVKGEDPDAKIKYYMATEDYLAMQRGEVSPMKLYNQKKVKVKASMPDLLKLQKLA